MTDCERCSNFVYDEVTGDYMCEAPFDEDEIAYEAESGRIYKNRKCPYFIEDGEYKTVNKQI